jgi:hypothetical protein
MKTTTLFSVVVVVTASILACSDAESVDPFPFDLIDAGIKFDAAEPDEPDSGMDANGPEQVTDKKDAGTPDPVDAASD